MAKMGACAAFVQEICIGTPVDPHHVLLLYASQPRVACATWGWQSAIRCARSSSERSVGS